MNRIIGGLFTLGILFAFTVNECLATGAQTGTQQIKANLTKQARTNFNEPQYTNGQQQMWNPTNRFELASIVPSVLIFGGLILLLIPLCLTLFTPFLMGNGMPYANNPWSSYAHGRRKREIVNQINKKARSIGLIDKDLDLDDLLPSSSMVLHSVINNLSGAIEKMSK